MADQLSQETSLDVSKLKVQDLKKELKSRGLSTGGNKTELIGRLQGSLKSSERISSESVDDLEEDLLNDDDDEHLEASDSVILDHDLDDSPKTEKRKIDESPEKAKEEKSAPPPYKKVILNRNVSTDTLAAVSADKKKEEEVKVDRKEEKKVIKLSELSAKERLEMRAKKFGVNTITDEAKKLVRAERFGTSGNSASSITSSTVSTNVDVLKQRAQRFGVSTSSVMSSLENKEKLEKRKARFGTNTTSTNGIDSQSEKAKQQRLERFKEPVK